MLIKASGITNLSDARYFAAREVRFLGFCLDEGASGYIEPSQLHAIREWVEGPLIVGEFSATPIEVVREAASFYRLDAVQVSAEQHQSALADLPGLMVLLRLPAHIQPDAAAELMQHSKPYVDFFVLPLTASSPDDTTMHAWGRLAAQYPILVHSDAGAGQLPGIIAHIKPAGISLTGGDEERPGVKSFEELEEIFEVLEAAS